jgi:hypothetical protein
MCAAIPKQLKHLAYARHFMGNYFSTDQQAEAAFTHSQQSAAKSLAMTSPLAIYIDLMIRNGGRDRDRTCDPFHVKEVLSR